jgi:2-hydroxycyclohexanecarboxyl-CoA dehydrogenase
MPVAMTTGGASWFSRGTAHLLIEDGWKIVLSDINEKALDEVVGALGRPAQVSSRRLDVTDLAAVKAFADRIAAENGTIDALVNVAGGSNYLGLGRHPFHEMDPAHWDLILRPNLYGVLNCCYAVLPHMIKARKGVIVSVSSGMGLKGKERMTTYSAAKAAIIAFSQSLCQEVGRYGIRVNTIAPGSAESRWQPDLTPAGDQRASPLGRRTSAEDVAHAIAFLVSERASHISGSCLDLSGGTSLH